MSDEEPCESLGQLRREMIELFRRVFESRHRLGEDLEKLLSSGVPLGVLSDIMTHALGLPAETKQELLAEVNIERRVRKVRGILQQLVDHGDLTPLFPPLFSSN
jgi:ATP-dependent Lon protease